MKIKAVNNMMSPPMFQLQGLMNEDIPGKKIKML